MTIAYMDLFYILSIGGIVAVLIMMEAQINQIKKMMEEHTRYEEPLKNGNQKLKRYIHEE